MNATTATATAATALLSAVIVLAGCGTTPTEVTATNPPATPTSTAGSGPSPQQPAPAGASTTTTTSTPVTPAVTTAASAGTVNRSDPTAVAEAMLDTTFRSNTTTDTSPYTAVKRSLAWFTPAAAARVLASAPTSPVGAEWITWTAHEVTTSVAVHINTDPGAPADTATSADRQFNVTVTPHGEDGWTTAPDQYQCFVTLTRTSPTGAWQVSNLQTAQ